MLSVILFSKRYEAEDEKLRHEQRAAFIRQRKEEMDEFTKVLDHLNQWKIRHVSFVTAGAMVVFSSDSLRCCILWVRKATG